MTLETSSLRAAVLVLYFSCLTLTQGILRYLLPALAATAVLAKTDQEGGTSFTSTVTVDPSPGYGNTYETVIWYVPDTLEICRGVDCGGGHAPPRKVPGCPAYSGTDTVTASFLTTNPAAKPTATPTALDGATVQTSPVAKLTLVLPVSTGESAPTGQRSSASEGDSTTTATGPAATAATVATDRSGTQSGTEAGSTNGVPAGAGPTARAGVAAVLGLAVAAVALA
ncbi:uncharacterized protein GLRG_01020 [Colletotrichum graminicola M1.001]|uniref:Siderophore biosynthesis protein n=1 Tax=Colletotrichum graminicola (strain M1.001 / M2 / FGSC 10212) TaxID=645133 RepID=E3Q5A9_COLGM|nr:uncharacterized protein GLRG_01020 [Colletotrichum graminicola M1.001]EFQ25876.1 hypothetical protein GLRG_01020 [Colletotrichum graminicola M1.001]